MDKSGFWIILFAVALYGGLHSVLAANSVKALAENWFGVRTARRYYRLFFVLVAVITFLPVLALAVLLPDQPIYAIPTPWVFLTLALQGMTVVGILLTVSQTGAARFLGIQQWLAYDSDRNQPRPESLVVNGFYRWVRHPLYTFSFILLWFVPIMTWNILAVVLGLSAYMLIGIYFEERKLVEQFGSAYVDYRRRTPLLVPGLKFRH